MNRNRIILSGGGTGGHIYPAISIANELLLREKHSEILFVGAKNKMEMPADRSEFSFLFFNMS